MKSQMRMEFEARHGFEVCDDMDIQTSVAWDNWKEAWKAAIDHARYKANECADNNAYTPAQKRALGAWLQRVALTVEDETPNAKSQATDAALSRQVACTNGLGGGSETGE